MKKLFYLLLALPLFAFVACSDDDKDIPNVDVNVAISGAYQVPDDNVIYVVQGETMTIDDVTLTSHTGKEAVISSVTYVWDYVSVGTSVISPFTRSFEMVDVAPGNHVLQLNMVIAAVGYPITNGVVAYPVKVVASVDDLPAGAELMGTAPEANLIVSE